MVQFNLQRYKKKYVLLHFRLITKISKNNEKIKTYFFSCVNSIFYDE